MNNLSKIVITNVIWSDEEIMFSISKYVIKNHIIRLINFLKIFKWEVFVSVRTPKRTIKKLKLTIIVWPYLSEKKYNFMFNHPQSWLKLLIILMDHSLNPYMIIMKSLEPSEKKINRYMLAYSVKNYLNPWNTLHLSKENL